MNGMRCLCDCGLRKGRPRTDGIDLHVAGGAATDRGKDQGSSVGGKGRAD